MFLIEGNGVLTLTNCKSTGKVMHSSSSGGGVQVDSGTFNLYGGTIFKNTADYGGGVLVTQYTTFNMYGGSITDNAAAGDQGFGGGGVCVKGGTFNMHDGTIAANKATIYTGKGNGGGVSVVDGGRFTMNGGTIGGTSADRDYNQAKGNGGGVYVNGSTFEMKGSASVAYNKAIKGSSGDNGGNGGGVYVKENGKFIMHKTASVTGNTATNKGGGVYVSVSGQGSKFEMNDDASVTGNTTTGNQTGDNGDGGGVYVKSGTFDMNGNASVKNNETATKSWGGGVYVENGGTFNMNDGTISENTAFNGGGVYASGGSTFNMNGPASITKNIGNGVCVSNGVTFTVSGAPTVTGNTKEGAASNVYLNGIGTFITIGKTGLSDNASIGVTKVEGVDNGVIAKNVSTNYSGNFFSDNTQYTVEYDTTDKTNHKLVLKRKSGGTTEEHKHCICGETHTDVGDHTSKSETTFATKLWVDGDTLKMGDNEWKPTTTTVGSNTPSPHYVLSEGSYYLGSDIKLTESIHIQKGVKLCLNGHSIISDGTVVGRYVIIVESSSLVLTDCKGNGKITHADGKNGGGVSVYNPSSVFNMFGGIITGNNIDGGVENNGTFNMYGGEISDNEADNGGGVYVNQVGKFNMYGGSITGNRSVGGKGSGVYVNGGIEIPGSPDSASTKIVKITGNTGDNLYLAEGKVIKLGSVHYQTSVGVTTAVKPEKGNHVKIADVTRGDVGLSQNITSDDPQYVTERVGAMLVLKTKETEILVSGITLNGEKWNLKVGETKTLTATVTPSEATNKKVTWTSSEPDVATVENGVVTAKAAGTATITVKATDSSNVSATCEITVTGGTTPSQPGGSGGSGSSDSSDSNPIIKTETKNNADGSTTKTETRKDGTVTQTTTAKDGSVSKTETKKDGSSVIENKVADGSTGTVKTDKHGQTTAETALSSKAIETAKRNGEPVKAPVEVEATRDSSTAPTVKIELPGNSGDTKVEIPVSNVKPGTVAVIVHPDGTEEIVKNSLPTEDGIQLTVNGGATVKIVDNSKDFIDTRNHWAKDAIDFVSARGLVNGMNDSIYAPNNSTTRAQLWTILARQADADLTGGANWYEKAQAWAKEKGISDGANPNGTINRAQMVTMLWRAMGQPATASGASFADVPADSYYAQAVAWAIENGITAGVGGGRFDPNSTCTRAQIATFLRRAMAE